MGDSSASVLRAAALQTARLRLEPWPLALARAVVDGRLHDAAGVLDPAPGWPTADTLDGLRRYAEHGTADGEGGWYVLLAATGQVIGDCGWHGPPDGAGDVEIGYGLAAPFRAQGYGTELVAALSGWLDGQPGVRRLVAEVLVGNTASRRLLERQGFTVVAERPPYLRYARAVDRWA